MTPYHYQHLIYSIYELYRNTALSFSFFSFILSLTSPSTFLHQHFWLSKYVIYLISAQHFFFRKNAHLYSNRSRRWHTNIVWIFREFHFLSIVGLVRLHFLAYFAFLIASIFCVINHTVQHYVQFKGSFPLAICIFRIWLSNQKKKKVEILIFEAIK